MAGSQANKTVLIVEDEVPMLNSLVDLLSGEGLNIQEAKTGVQGLDAARNEHPDLIVLDIILPRMHGMHMFQEIRQEKWGESIPVIILTNLEYEEAMSIAGTLGASFDERIKKEIDSGLVEYYMKSDSKIKDIVSAIKKRLGVN